MFIDSCRSMSLEDGSSRTMAELTLLRDSSFESEVDILSLYIYTT